MTKEEGGSQVYKEKTKYELLFEQLVSSKIKGKNYLIKTIIISSSMIFVHKNYFPIYFQFYIIIIKIFLESALMDDSDEDHDMPVLSTDMHPIEKMTPEEEENIKKTLEFIENRMNFLDDKIKILNGASKKLVTLLKSEDFPSNSEKNLNPPTENSIQDNK